MKVDKEFLALRGQVTDEEFNTFAGKKAAMFHDTREKMLGLKKGANFTLPAFLIGPIYFAYYKIWTWVFIVIGIMRGFDIMAKIISLPPSTAIGTSIGVSSAIIFKPMYIKHAYKRIIRIKKAEPNIEHRLEKIKKAGGTSWVGVALCLCLLFIYSYVSLTFIGEAKKKFDNTNTEQAASQ